MPTIAYNYGEHACGNLRIIMHFEYKVMVCPDLQLLYYRGN